MSSVVLAVLVGGALASVALPLLGVVRFSVAAFLLGAALAPISLLAWNADAKNHTGLTESSPSIATYTLALLLLAGGLSKGWQRNGWLTAYGILLLSYLGMGLLTVWSGAEAQWSGALHLAIASVALAAGYQFGSRLNLTTYQFLIGIIFLIFFLNGLLCVAQLAGIPATLYPKQYAHFIASGRPIGTFSHPGTFGKFVVITLMLVFPALACGHRRTRRLAWWCVGIAVPLAAFTLARANVAAVIVAIVLWVVLDRSKRNSAVARLGFLIAVLVASAPLVSATLERFATDPGGGDRGEIYRTGFKQLQSNFFAGTGPNYYAEVVGRWDQLTAWGYPLHNTFLYPVAELGLVGGVLFILPVFVTGALALVDSLQGQPSPWSKAYLVTFPGIFAIGMTGWGLLIGSSLCLWYFMVGACAGGLTRPDEAGLFRQPGDAAEPCSTRAPLIRQD